MLLVSALVIAQGFGQKNHDLKFVFKINYKLVKSKYRYFLSNLQFILLLLWESACTLGVPTPTKLGVRPRPPPQTRLLSPWLRLRHCIEKSPLVFDKGNLSNKITSSIVVI